MFSGLDTPLLRPPHYNGHFTKFPLYGKFISGKNKGSISNMPSPPLIRPDFCGLYVTTLMRFQWSYNFGLFISGPVFMLEGHFQEIFTVLAGNLS